MPDQLHLRGLELECIVGVRPPERKRAQRIRLDVSLGLNLAVAGRSGRILQTIDYSCVADEIQRLLRFREYRLVEMATEELCAMLFAAHPELETVDLTLEKPEALRGRAVAAVSVTRTRESFLPTRRSVRGGHADRFLLTCEASLDVITLEPGARYAPSPCRRVLWLTRGSLLGEKPALEASEPRLLETPVTAGSDGASLFVCETIASL